MLSDRQVYVQGQQVLSAEDPNAPDVGGVWISGFHFAKNLGKLAKCRIGAVVSAIDLGIDYEGLNPKQLVLNI